MLRALGEGVANKDALFAQLVSAPVFRDYASVEAAWHLCQQHGLAPAGARVEPDKKLVHVCRELVALGLTRKLDMAMGDESFRTTLPGELNLRRPLQVVWEWAQLEVNTFGEAVNSFAAAMSDAGAAVPSGVGAVAQQLDALASTLTSIPVRDQASPDAFEAEVAAAAAQATADACRLRLLEWCAARTLLPAKAATSAGLSAVHAPPAAGRLASALRAAVWPAAPTDAPTAALLSRANPAAPHAPAELLYATLLGCPDRVAKLAPECAAVLLPPPNAARVRAAHLALATTTPAAGAREGTRRDPERWAEAGRAWRRGGCARSGAAEELAADVEEAIASRTTEWLLPAAPGALSVEAKARRDAREIACRSRRDARERRGRAGAAGGALTRFVHVAGERARQSRRVRAGRPLRARCGRRRAGALPTPHRSVRSPLRIAPPGPRAAECGRARISRGVREGARRRARGPDASADCDGPAGGGRAVYAAAAARAL